MKRSFLFFLLLLTLVLLSVSPFAFAVETFDERQSFVETSFEKRDLSDYEREKKFREEFGLEAGLAVNTELKSSEIYGVSLTLDEVNELNERFAFQERVIPEIKDYLNKLTDYDYSIYIDQKKGGVINIGVKDKRYDVYNELKHLIPDKGKLEINFIKYTEKDLGTVHERINSSWGELEKKGIYINDITTDVINQKVIVGVSNFTVEYKDFFKKEFGDTVEVRNATKNINNNRANTWNPIVGGAKITYHNNSYKCSVGFMANDGFTNYVVTAGHCNANPSDTYYQGSTLLGTMPHKNNKNHSDAGAIAQNNSLNYSGGKIYKTATTTDKYDRTQNANEDVVGEIVCMSGASTDTNSVKCGVLESKNFSGKFAGTKFTKLRKASYESNGGDSGGTVYGGTKLKGVNKGHSGTSGVYSHLEYVIDDLNNVSNRTFSILF